MSMYEILSFALMGHRRASEGSRGILDSSSLGVGGRREGRTGRKNGAIFVVAF